MIAFRFHTQGGHWVFLGNHEPSPKIKELYVVQVRAQLASDMVQTHRGKERTNASVRLARKAYLPHTWSIVVGFFNPMKFDVLENSSSISTVPCIYKISALGSKRWEFFLENLTEVNIDSPGILGRIHLVSSIHFLWHHRMCLREKLELTWGSARVTYLGLSPFIKAPDLTLPWLIN